jgi:hypothetical protein
VVFDTAGLLAGAVPLEVSMVLAFDGFSFVAVVFARDPAFARVPFMAAGRPGAVPLPLPLVPVVIGFGLVVEVAFLVALLDFAEAVFAGTV